MSQHAQRGWAALSHDKFEIAEKEFRMALAENPDDANAHAALSHCLSGMEKLDEAEAEAKIAISLDPNYDYSYFVLARVYFERNRFDDAIKTVQTAIQLDPEDANYRSLLAAIYSQKHQWADSLAAADAGLAIDAEHDGCINLRAIALTHLGRKDEAASTIQGALERAPENSLTHANKGWSLLHQNNPTKALEHFREALRIDPTNDWAREGLLTALKAKNPFYRMMLAFFLFMNRQSDRSRWVIIIGILVGQNILLKVGKGDDPIAWIAWTIAITAIVFVILTWLANPLMNIIMRFHPHGRYALTHDQRQQANLIGGCLLISAGLFICEFVIESTHMSSIMFLLVCLPILIIHLSERGWPRRISSLIAVTFFFMATIVASAVFLSPPLEDIVGENIVAALNLFAIKIIHVYFWGILIWSLAGNIVINSLPKK